MSVETMLLALLALLGFVIGFLGAFTDVNRHYARIGGVVNYNPVQSPLVGALTAPLESPGIGHLKSMGWLPLPAVMFPLIIIFIMIIGFVLVMKCVQHES